MLTRIINSDLFIEGLNYALFVVSGYGLAVIVNAL